MKSNQSLLIIVLSSLLAACGGGSGGSSPAPNPAPPVVTPPTPATATLVTKTSLTTVNSSITLTWSSTDAATCIASGSWAGDVGKSGTKDLNPSLGSAEYIVTCGSAVAKVTVEALPATYAVPDSKFETVLVAKGLDTVVDGKVDTAKALTAESLLITAEAGITDLTGLEAFRNLTRLQIEHQRGLSKIDPTKLTKLTFFNVWDCPITNLDVSKNVALKNFGLSQTELSTIDLSALVNVEELALHNDADSPETTGYPYGITKGLKSLDISKNVNLVRLYVGFNLLTSIDTSSNPKLQEFWGAYNQFATLDFSKNNAALSYVVLYNTTKMTSPLRSLNVKNTAAGGVLARLYTKNNPLLKEIRVTSVKAVQDHLAKQLVGRTGYDQDTWTAFTEQ